VNTVNSTTPPSVRRAIKYRRAAAVLLVLGSVSLLSPRASAQLGLGSLVVTITAPAAGSTVSGTTTVTAQVSIVGALTVSNVQFKLDGNNLGAADSSSPYSISWDTRTAANGAHTLTAVARDLLGVSWTSPAVNVTVFNDTTPPSVALSSPAPGAALRGTITIAASASDNAGVTGVQFRLDGANLGAEDTTAPYSLPWNTSTAGNGSHVLTAVARDAAGNTATSATISVVIDNAPPAVSITSPAGGSTVRGAVTIRANASDNVAVAGVRFFVDGTPLGAEDLIAPFEAAWNTASGSNGSHVLTATARDAVGNVTTSAGVTLTVDNSAPAVSITSPAAGATVSGSITVTANASDNVGVAGVQFFVDGTMLGAEDTSAPYAMSWDTTTATSGSKVLTAVARDATGNTATSASVAVTVNNDSTVPTVAITAPAAGATVSGAITVSANAADNVAVAGVQFFVDGAMLGVEDTSAPYSVSWDTTAASGGSKTLTAVARDTSGNTATSASVAVTVMNDATGPTVAITSPANGATVSAALTVTADASDNVAVSGVQFFVDGVALGTEDTTAPYSVAWNTAAATDGSHTLTATARDAAGNTTTSAVIAVTVSNQTSSATRLEDNNPAISYTPAGSWLEGYTGGFGWSGGTAALGFTAGQRATLNFNGTGVSWIGFRGPQTGIAIVYLDGAPVATVDAYSPTEILQAALYSATGLANGPHTLAIEVTRTKNDAASDYYVVVDAFEVTSQGGGAPTDTTPPSASISAPAGGATVTGTITVTANASDNVGVAGLKLFVDGVQVGVEDTAAPYGLPWATMTATNGAHTLTVVARDSAGNTTTSASVSVTVSNTSTPPAAVATRFEDTDLAITYLPGTTAPGQPPEWFHGSRSRDWSNDTSAFNRSPGSRATFAFTGTSVSWIGFRAFWAGIARVYVDDVFVDQVDLFLPPCTPEQKAQGCVDEDDQAPVFTASGLAPGPHTLTIEVTGTRNANASDNAVVVDGFDVAPVVPTSTVGTRIQETAAAVAYTGAWAQGDTSTSWSGGAAAVSATTGARATVTFTGTEVRWVGRRGPQAGIARIFLDGAFQAEFDQYFATDLIGVNYTATGLAPGSHTLTIEVTGAKNAAATGAEVAVDAFDVRSRFEERDAAATYTGAWVQEHMGRPWSGTTPNNGTGTAARAAAAGASAEFTFSGSQVQWISTRGPGYGMADVSIDGVVIDRVDLYAATEVMRAAVFTHGGLGPGTHRLRIDVTGLKNGASTGTFVFVDAFDVVLPEPAPVVTRIQQTDAAVAYTTGATGWTQSSPNLFFSGRTVALATAAGARATFTFTGTSVRWIGQRRRDSGIARVYLNGTLVAVVDTYTPIQDEFQAAMFSATGLGPGTHTLTIEATGTKHGGPDCSPGPAPPCASGYMVIVDAFEVYQQ
jgi:hypothetical protein